MRIKYVILIALAMGSIAAGAQSKKKATTAKSTAVKTAGSPMTARAKALYEDMLPNTQKIFIIDSTVVDSRKVLDAIPLPKAYGRYVAYDEFFATNGKSDTYVFVNGFNNRCFFTEVGTDSIARLYSCDKQGDAWGKPQPITEINECFKHISFPYMSSDGQTLYFSAESIDDGLGKRDIYMAKYDADEGHFLQAENIGLPFNSSADDYAYVEADADHLAWFATTRRQPSGKACVYTFVPYQPRQNYAADEIPDSRLRSYANITRIRDTWPTPEYREKAMAHLEKLKQDSNKAKGDDETYEFIVNDNTVYHNVDNFMSDETRRDFHDIIRLRNDIKNKTVKLDNMRTQYHNATAAEREALGRKIAQMEERLSQSRTDLKTASDNLRRKECRLTGK